MAGDTPWPCHGFLIHSYTPPLPFYLLHLAVRLVVQPIRNKSKLVEFEFKTCGALATKVLLASPTTDARRVLDA